MIAAFISNNSIIAKSNIFKTHPEAETLGKFQHAEFNVLKQVEDGSRGKLFIYREKKDGSFGMAKPCKVCRSLILAKGIREIIYTTDTGYIRERT